MVRLKNNAVSIKIVITNIQIKVQNDYSRQRAEMMWLYS